MTDRQFAYLLSFVFWTTGVYCVESDTKGFNEYRFYDGEWINDWPEDINFIVDGENCKDFLLCELHYHMISDRVRCAFVEIDVEGVQFLPVKIFHRSIKENTQTYWALNVLTTVKKLRWDTIQGKDIFRYATTSVYVSDRLKSHLEQANLTSGASFDRITQKTLDRDNYS